MGQKVNPRSFRTTTTYRIPSRWFATHQDYARNLQIDTELRRIIKKKFKDGGVARVEIERATGEITIIVYTSKPGVVIGRGGSLIDELKAQIKKQFYGSVKMKVNVNIQEVADPDLNAEIIYQSIRDQIEQRVPFRRAIKRSMEQVMRAGAKGCRIQVAGRLNGVEIARTETISEGRLPLHTLRANIDYSRGVAHTIYGVIGIKVWIYTGDVFGEMPEAVEKKKKQKKKPKRRPRKKRLQTDGKKTILRKKSEVDKEKTAVSGEAKKPAAKKKEITAKKKSDK